MHDPVLLVEDELFIALDLQDTIERAGFGVDGPYASVADATDAITQAGERGFVAALLDVSLSDGVVFPVADRLQAAGVPLIFHSGHADGADLHRRYPAARICPKPSSPSELTAALLDCTDRSRAAKGAAQQQRAY